jgi:hypothetical protein
MAMERAGRGRIREHTQAGESPAEPVGRPLGEHGERASGPMILLQTEARDDLL